MSLAICRLVVELRNVIKSRLWKKKHPINPQSIPFFTHYYVWIRYNYDWEPPLPFCDVYHHYSIVPSQG